MMKKIFLLILIFIGGFMVVITSNKLGEQGNRVMNFMGIIIFLGGVLSSLYLSIKKNKD